MHGHTYQSHAVGCAAVLVVQQIIQEDSLISNVRIMGKLLENRLRDTVGQHPNVGDIRGRGLFWGIEFVQNKLTKTPFLTTANVANKLNALGLAEKYSIVVYPGNGTADGIAGDHIILAPPYTVTAEDIEHIVQTVSKMVDEFFAVELNKGPRIELN